MLRSPHALNRRPTVRRADRRPPISALEQKLIERADDIGCLLLRQRALDRGTLSELEQRCTCRQASFGLTVELEDFHELIEGVRSFDRSVD